MSQGLLFDWDDTLVDTFNSRVPAIIEFCRRQGLNVSKQQIGNVWGVPFNRMMASLGCTIPIDMTEYLAIAKRHPLIAFQDAERMLQKLAQTAYLGIVTSLAESILHADLTALCWDLRWFKVIVTQESTSYHKPDPRVFDEPLRILSLHGIDRSSIIYIGDRPTDAVAARDAQISFIGIGRTAEQRQSFAGLAHRVARDLTELERIIYATDQK